VEKSLFIRLRLLGDIVFTIPAVQLYLTQYPDHRITYLVEEEYAGAARLIPGIHEVAVVPRRMTLRDHLSFYKSVRAQRYDRVIDFHSGPKSALLTFLSGAPIRIGYRTPNRNWAFNRLTPRFVGSTPGHSVTNQVRLLEHVGIDAGHAAEKIPAYPPVSIPEPGSGPEIFERVQDRPRVVVHLGAGNHFRDWGLDNFARLIECLLTQGHAPILIGHSEPERERGTYLASRYPVIDLTGRLKIDQTLYVIAHSRAYVGIDSGPLHLASLTETPIVALYGPNIPAVSGPWRRDRVTIVETRLSCRPCSQRRCRYDTIRCMKEIEVERVCRAVQDHLV